MSVFLDIDQYVGRTGVLPDLASRLGEWGLVGDVAAISASNPIRTVETGWNARVRVVKNSSGGTLAPSLGVKFAASAVGTEISGLSGANEAADGFVDPFISGTVADGAIFLLFEEGMFDCVASAAISAGAEVKTAANGQIVTNAQSAVADLVGHVGRAVEAAASAGNTIKVCVKKVIR